MSSTQILVLGALAGVTIFIGLPLGRVQSTDVRLKAALSGLATGILLFLLYDVFAHGVVPVEEALEGAVDEGGSWLEFSWLAALFAHHLTRHGATLRHSSFFDTVVVEGVAADAVLARAVSRGFNLRRVSDDAIGVAFDETTTPAVVSAVAEILTGAAVDDAQLTQAWSVLPESMLRTDEFLTQAPFRDHRSEHAMLRYLRRLADRDLALDRTMIPLGSCTMKLNAATEMEPVTWPEFANIHPFAPDDQTEGYRAMIAELDKFRSMLEDLGGGLGVTDPVSGDAVVELKSV